jgi:hypothetical protein
MPIKVQQMFSRQLTEQSVRKELAFYRGSVMVTDAAEGVAIHGVEMSQGLLRNSINYD